MGIILLLLGLITSIGTLVKGHAEKNKNSSISKYKWYNILAAVYILVFIIGLIDLVKKNKINSLDEIRKELMLENLEKVEKESSELSIKLSNMSIELDNRQVILDSVFQTLDSLLVNRKIVLDKYDRITRIIEKQNILKSKELNDNSPQLIIKAVRSF
jgi:hypothetical protein